MSKAPRSTVFLSERLSKRTYPKQDQEAAAGEALAQAYVKLTGTPLVNQRRPANDPPDLLFEWRDRRIGVELFELPSFYDARAMLETFTNLVYERFAEPHMGDRFVGVAITLGLLVDVNFMSRIETEWRRGGIRRPLQRAAQDLTDLVSIRVPSQDALPDDDFGLVIEVDVSDHPALGALTKSVICTRCRVDDPRRSDGRAAPLLIAHAGYDYANHEIVKAIEGQLVKKVSRRQGDNLKRWSAVDHSVLVAHDFPRRHMSEFLADWEPLLRRAAEATHASDHFNELWLLSRPTERGEAYRIFGTTPGG